MLHAEPLDAQLAGVPCIAQSQAVPRLQSVPARCLFTSCTYTAVVPLMLAPSSHFCYKRLLESCCSSYRTTRLARRSSWRCQCFCSTERCMPIRALHNFRTCCLSFTFSCFFCLQSDNGCMSHTVPMLHWHAVPCCPWQVIVSRSSAAGIAA